MSFSGLGCWSFETCPDATDTDNVVSKRTQNPTQIARFFK